MRRMLIYGATGFTGTLVAEHAAAADDTLQPVLAGRDADRVERLARRLGLPWAVFDLRDRAGIERRLAGAAAVLNIAGPFSRTAAPLVDACLATRTHYIDVTGEISVFEHLAARDAQARAAGIVLLPGAGFDVVPSDCLAAHLKSRLPAMRRLRLSISGLTRPSRGTARTAVEALARPTLARRGGRIVALETAPRHHADFGDGPRETVGVSWGDVATAWHSTGAAEIDVLFEATRAMRAAARCPAPLRRLLGARPVQPVLQSLAGRLATGPSAALRESGRARILGEAWDEDGVKAASLMETPEPYALTQKTALALARRVAAGEVPAGFHTPATAFGADLALGFDGVSRRDI